MDYPPWMHAWFATVPREERDEDGVHLSAAAETYLADDRDLVLVTHAFVAAWFVRQVLGAPRTAWTAVAAANAGLTTIDRRPGRPPELAGVNDVSPPPRRPAPAGAGPRPAVAGPRGGGPGRKGVDTAAAGWQASRHA